MGGSAQLHQELEVALEITAPYHRASSYKHRATFDRGESEQLMSVFVICYRATGESKAALKRGSSDCGTSLELSQSGY